MKWARGLGFRQGGGAGSNSMMSRQIYCFIEGGAALDGGFIYCISIYCASWKDSADWAAKIAIYSSGCRCTPCHSQGSGPQSPAAAETIAGLSCSAE